MGKACLKASPQKVTFRSPSFPRLTWSFRKQLLPICGRVEKTNRLGNGFVKFIERHQPFFLSTPFLPCPIVLPTKHSSDLFPISVFFSRLTTVCLRSKPFFFFYPPPPCLPPFPPPFCQERYHFPPTGFQECAFGKRLLPPPSSRPVWTFL